MPSTQLQRYLTLETLALDYERERRDDLADAIRDVMDPVWHELLTEEDRRFLNERSLSLR